MRQDTARYAIELVLTPTTPRRIAQLSSAVYLGTSQDKPKPRGALRRAARYTCLLVKGPSTWTVDSCDETRTHRGAASLAGKSAEESTHLQQFWRDLASESLAHAMLLLWPHDGCHPVDFEPRRRQSCQPSQALARWESSAHKGLEQDGKQTASPVCCLP